MANVTEPQQSNKDHCEILVRVKCPISTIYMKYVYLFDDHTAISLNIYVYMLHMYFDFTPASPIITGYFQIFFFMLNCLALACSDSSEKHY